MQQFNEKFLYFLWATDISEEIYIDLVNVVCDHFSRHTYLVMVRLGLL